MAAILAEWQAWLGAVASLACLVIAVECIRRAMQRRQQARHEMIYRRWLAYTAAQSPEFRARMERAAMRTGANIRRDA